MNFSNSIEDDDELNEINLDNLVLGFLDILLIRLERLDNKHIIRVHWNKISKSLWNNWKF